MKKKINQNNIIEHNKINVKNIKIALFLILIVIVITFSPSFKSDFVNFDDNVLVYENLKIRDLSLEEIKLLFTIPKVGLYHPLVLLSYSIEYKIFELNPFIYHLTNIVLHLLNSILVFVLIYLLSKKMPVSLIAALLFAIHPLRTESVAWITGRKDVLYAFFFLMTIISYLYYKRNNIIKYYYISIITFVVTILSKSVAVMLPFILILCDYFTSGRINKKSIIEKIPFLAITLIFGGITTIIQKESGNIGYGGSFTFLYNIQNASTGLLFYIAKTIAPLKLSCLYPRLDKIGGIFSHIFQISPVLVIILVAIIFYTNKFTKKILFGSMFFLISILPVLHIIPLGWAIPADRYTYVPLIGLFYLVGEGFNYFYGKKYRNNKIIKNLLLITIVSILFLLSILTHQRSKVWRNSITLWNNVIKNYPDSRIAYYDRGMEYIRLNECNKAISDFTKAIEIDRNYSLAYFERGKAYYERKEYDKAIFDFTQVILEEPNNVDAYHNRGSSYGGKEDFDKAISDFSKAIEINPDYMDAYKNRAVAYYFKKNYDKSWEDIYKLQKMNYNVDTNLINELNKVYRK